MRTAGIHYITAVASDPARNVAFYVEVLGLRLVKRTVNFDDPGGYHFYFGDEMGSPGTIIAFFLWPGAHRVMPGSGPVAATSFAITEDSFDLWKERLREIGFFTEEMEPRFGERLLRFTDPDGLLIEFVVWMDRSRVGEATRAVHSIRGFAGPTLCVKRPAETEKLLVHILGFEFVAEEKGRRRFRARGETSSSLIDIVAGDEHIGRIAVGGVHHIAFRAANEEEQLHWREQLIEGGFVVSPVMDRNYFRSIYFREPHSILFEIATDGPGFTVDEPYEALGQALKLPSVFEPMRAGIERVLPPLETVATP